MSKARFRVVKSYNKTPSGGGIGTDGLDDTCLIINEDTSNGKDNGIYLGTFDKCIANYTPAAVATSGSYNDLTDKPTIPTKLSQLTDDVVAGKYLPTTIYGSFDADTLFNDGFQSGNILHQPSCNPYGIVHTLSYRGGRNNAKPDYAAQIFIPRGDDSTSPNDMFFRTSLADTWNTWTKVITDKNIKSTLGISDWALAASKPTYTASEVGALMQDSSTTNADLDAILDNKTSVLKPFFQKMTNNDIGSARKGVLRMSFNGSESQLLFDHYNRQLRYRTIGENPKDWATLAFTSDIPTKLSQLTDDVVAGKYLPLSGGNIVSDKESILTIRSSSPNSYAMFYANGTNRASVGYYKGLGYIANEISYARIGVTDTGEPQYWDSYRDDANKYTLLHSGNIGNYEAGSSVWSKGLDRIPSITASGHCVYFYSGQPTLGDDINNAKEGSNAYHLWSYPVDSTDVGNGMANIMNLRLQFNFAYLHDIFVSPNRDDVWHRSIINQRCGPWRKFAFTSDIPTKLSQLTDDVVAGKYLPLSGGSLFGAIGISSGNDAKLILNNTDAENMYQYISFQQGGVEYGQLGTFGYNELRWSGNEILHSGNIGNYKAGDSDKLGGYDISRFLLTTGRNYTTMDLNTIGDKQSIFTEIRTGEVTTSNCPISGYGALLSLKDGNSYAKLQILSASGSSDTYIRCTQGAGTTISSNWNKVITDNNIGNYNAGSATKLAKYRKLWGNDFDGTADVSGRMYVDGDFFIEHSTTGRQLSMSSYWTILGYNNTTIGNPTYVDGHNVYIRYGNDEYVSVFASSGNVGIGNTSPTEKLDVTGNVKANGFIKSNSSDSYVLLGGGGHKAISDFADTNYYHTRSYSSGLQISTGTGVSNMYVPYATASQAGVISTGDQTFAGAKTFNSTVKANAFYSDSDERLKTFGEDIKVDFDELAKLRKSHFVFNNNPTKQEIGVSAQEVQKIYPEIVNETEEGTLSVDYSKLAVVALAAIDKLNQRVQELENKLAKYE